MCTIGISWHSRVADNWDLSRAEMITLFTLSLLYDGHDSIAWLGIVDRLPDRTIPKGLMYAKLDSARQRTKTKTKQKNKAKDHCAPPRSEVITLTRLSPPHLSFKCVCKRDKDVERWGNQVADTANLGWACTFTTGTAPAPPEYREPKYGL